MGLGLGGLEQMGRGAGPWGAIGEGLGRMIGGCGGKCVEGEFLVFAPITNQHFATVHDTSTRRCLL